MKRRMIVMLFIASIMLLQGTLSLSFGMPQAKITIKVINEDGMPASSEEVKVGFAQGIKDVIITGFTDGNGAYSVTNQTIGQIGCEVVKEGFYKSYVEYRFGDIKNDMWQPWNPDVRTILRKIEKPVPMYARRTKMSGLEMPVVGKEVGFDLLEYEWMPPFGKGKHADFIFKLDKRMTSEDDFESTLTLTFPGKYDGIQLIKEDLRYGSVFKLPRFAPVTGYQQILTRLIRRSPGKPIEVDFQDDNNYIFRVRSEVRNGKLLHAMYGKIQGDIEVYPGNSKTAAIVFKYYLNPDYTRNLEYDPNRNLFQNLKSFEQVGL